MSRETVNYYTITNSLKNEGKAGSLEIKNGDMNCVQCMKLNEMNRCK